MAGNVDVRTSLAMSKSAVTVADLAALASPQGVPLPLDKGSNQLLVLFSPPCCNHHGSRAVPQVSHPAAAFNTAEHIITVAGCRLKMPQGKTADALQARLSVGPNLLLTYGQVIALGGDFYGDPDHPVCTAGDQTQQINQFEKNFASLQSSAAEVKKLLGIAQHYEFNPIAERVRKNQPPSGVYAGLPTTPPHVVPDEDREFDEATGGTQVHNGRYLNLATTNLDHFGTDAIQCYMAGHILAQRRAIEAKTSPTPENALQVAYAINAFADHFLTDLFAAGHMRTPRRKLYEYTTLPSTFSGLCTKGMHDEDNKFGLWVENERGDKWVAYGDARYRDWVNTANRKVMKAALQQSMDDVWNAFDKGIVVGNNDCEVLRYIPNIVKDIYSSEWQKRVNDRSNWAPLFYWDPQDNYIYQRTDLNNVSDRAYDWKYSAGLIKTALQLQLRAGPYMPEQQYKGAGYPYPPNEAGPSGEIGWPAGPTSIAGPMRIQRGATGPDLNLRPDDWRIDGATGPAV